MFVELNVSLDMMTVTETRDDDNNDAGQRVSCGCYDG